MPAISTPLVSACWQNEGFARIGADIGAPGMLVMVSAKVAAEWGLGEGNPIAVGMIDDHAGGVGSVGARGRGRQPLYPHGLCDGYIGLHNLQPGQTGLRAGRVGPCSAVVPGTMRVASPLTAPRSITS